MGGNPDDGNPNDADPSDADLADRIAAGDPEALSLLYDRHAPRLFGLVLAIVGDRAAAETVLAEAFYRLWAQPVPAAGRRRSPATRLFDLGRELAIAEARRRAPGLTRTDSASARARTAFASLPDDQRRVLELAYFDGLPEREIAGRVGRSVRQVRRLLRLGFARLRDQVDGTGESSTR